MCEACRDAMGWNGPTVIDVEGEEDLSPILLILLCPLGAVIMYGQPGEGIVVRRVDLAANIAHAVSLMHSSQRRRSDAHHYHRMRT